MPFTWEQYELMATKLKNLKGKAVVSINDHPAIRECFKDFEMEELKLDYIVGGGANRVERRAYHLQLESRMRTSRAFNRNFRSRHEYRNSPNSHKHG